MVGVGGAVEVEVLEVWMGGTDCRRVYNTT